MGCNCKDLRREIGDGKKVIADLRELFIHRMTVDSDHNDRRRIDRWNENCERFGFPKKKSRRYISCMGQD